MKFCKKCVMPNTKPDLTFDEEGVCDACRSFERKHGDHIDSIDWNKRKKEFEELIAKYRNKNPTGYDGLIPVSGGKDSIYQVHMMKNKFNSLWRNKQLGNEKWVMLVEKQSG